MSRRRRAGRCGAMFGVVAFVLIIGQLSEHFWWAAGVSAALVLAWLVVEIMRTGHDLDAELERSNARITAAGDKKHARISNGDRSDPDSANRPERGREPPTGPE